MEKKISRLYEHSALDALVETATYLAEDVVQRPLLYNSSSVAAAESAGNFRSLVGHSPNWPRRQQRFAVYRAVFDSRFDHLRQDLASAITSFANGPGELGGWQKSSIKDKLIAINAHFNSINGAGLEKAIDEVEAIFSAAVSLIRDPAIATAYGIVDPIDASWPMSGTLQQRLHPSGAKLIAKIGTTSSMLSDFPQLQQIAYFGGETLALATDATRLSNSLDTGAIASILGWAQSLSVAQKKLSIRRAWTEPAYRNMLSFVEASLLPSNPSGDVDVSTLRLPMTAMSPPGCCGPFSTQTVSPDDICCSTGDLSCDPPGGSWAIALCPQGTATEYKGCCRTAGIECA